MDDGIEFVKNAEGEPISVIVPIELWRQIELERETLKQVASEAMKRRLLDAVARSDQDGQKPKLV